MAFFGTKVSLYKFRRRPHSHKAIKFLAFLSLSRVVLINFSVLQLLCDILRFNKINIRLEKCRRDINIVRDFQIAGKCYSYPLPSLCDVDLYEYTSVDRVTITTSEYDPVRNGTKVTRRALGNSRGFEKYQLV